MPVTRDSKPRELNTTSGTRSPTGRNGETRRTSSEPTRRQASSKVAAQYSTLKFNDYRLVTALNYPASVLAIRFFGTHTEYDAIDAETI